MTVDTSREAVQALTAYLREYPSGERAQRAADTLAALLDGRDALREDRQIERESLHHAVERIHDLEAELVEIRRQHDGVQREWAHRGKRLREVANERDALSAKLDAVKAFIANRSVIGGMDRMRLVAILADTDEGNER